MVKVQTLKNSNTLENEVLKDLLKCYSEKVFQYVNPGGFTKTMYDKYCSPQSTGFKTYNYRKLFIYWFK